MTATAVAVTTKGDQRVARPLRVLVPLIQDDLKHGQEAAERAGMPHYQAAGEKLIEAKSQLKHGEFVPWVERNFNVSIRQAQRYIALAEDAGGKSDTRVVFESLRHHERETGRIAQDDTGKTSWHEPVKQIVARVDTETLNLKREELKRQEIGRAHV